jgi:RNA polymerase sigma factor (sigma-70 family)
MAIAAIRAFEAPATGSECAPDRELLQRFAARRDEAAFAEIVRRHGPMLSRLCRRVLHSGHDAEDVCQAAFLVLARQAEQRRWQSSVAGWLFQVAYRLALKARTAAGRRSKHEARARATAPPDPVAEVTVAELQAVLDEELSLLPEKYRSPILLCCLEGKSRDEAARCLGWPLVTVKDRLEAGRERLRLRLARRGLPLGTALLSAWLLNAGSAAACAAPAAAAKAALAVAAGRAKFADLLPSRIAALAQESLARGATTAMVARTLTLAAVFALLLGVGATGTIPDVPAAAPAPVPQTRAAVVQPSPQQAGDKEPQRPREMNAQPLAIPLAGHKGAVHAVAFGKGGDVLATAGADKTVRIWDIIGERELHKFGMSDVAVAVAFTADNKLAALASGQAGQLVLFNAETGKALWQNQLAGAAGPGAVAVAPDGKTVAALAGDGVAWGYDAATGKALFASKLAPGKERASMAYAADGKTLVVAPGSESVYSVDGMTGRLTRKWGGKRPVAALGFLAGGTKVVAADGGTALRTLDLATGKEEAAFEGPERVTCVAVTPDGKWAATSGLGDTIVIWDLTAGKPERRFTAASTVTALALSPDGKLLATASSGGAVVYDLTRDEKPLPKDLTLTAKELDALWADLASDEIGKAYTAARLLQADPTRAIPFLTKHLQPKVERPDADKLKQLIADLDSEQFKKREAANKELERLGPLAEAALRKALADNPPLELKNRVERLLKLLAPDGKPLTAAQQRDVRAVRVLERAGTAEARQLLVALAAEAHGWWLRQEAEAALKRLGPAKGPG